MSSVFNILPGVEVPADEIVARLAELWRNLASADGASAAPDDAKATQVNFVLHLGLPTTPEDAAAQFQTVLRFSQRYPSRMVILCPQSDAEDQGGMEIRAKIYGECHFGKSPSDQRCVEVVTLDYSRAARGFLENQVSICLSTDLPLYYWAHRFSASSRLADYRYLLSRAERVLIDSANAPDDALSYPWPNLSALRDLAYARLLPVRQTVGQFLAAYELDVLARDLEKVAVRHAPDCAAEGRVIAGWLRKHLTDCGAALSAENYVVLAGSRSLPSLEIEFTYAQQPDKYFRWAGNFRTAHAHFAASLAGSEARIDAPLVSLSPELALSEAMFF